MKNKNEPNQEEMYEFMKNEFPEDIDNYEKLVKLWENSENKIYTHSIRNFVLLFFIPIVVVLVIGLLIKLKIIK